MQKEEAFGASKATKEQEEGAEEAKRHTRWKRSDMGSDCAQRAGVGARGEVQQVKLIRGDTASQAKLAQIL